MLTVFELLILFYIHLNYLIFLVDVLNWKWVVKKKGKMPKVSVIIPTRDDENVIEETLKRLRASYPRNKMEIIVVDYSRDKTKKIAIGKKVKARSVILIVRIMLFSSDLSDNFGLDIC